MQQISAEELFNLLRTKRNETLLLDVRDAWERELCNIEGSIHMSVMEIANHLNELDPEAEIVVICHHGMRSMQVAGYLETNGFNKVSNLAGGIDAWALSVEPEMTRY